MSAVGPGPACSSAAEGTLPRVRSTLPHAILAVVLASLLAVLVPAIPAAAHAELESSSPADGADLKVAPKRVALVFGEDLLAGANAVTATDLRSDTRVELPAPELSGNKLTVAWPESAPGGEYRVAFRVVSADGHPITGRISFSYSKARVAASGVVASPSLTPTPSEAAGSPSISDSAQALAPTPDKAPMAPATVAGILAAGVIALAVLGVGAWRTRRRGF